MLGDAGVNAPLLMLAIGERNAGIGCRASTVGGRPTWTTYLSLPEGDGPFPAMIVIHHAPGVDHVRSGDSGPADAREGYIAAAPEPVSSNNRRDGGTDRPAAGEINSATRTSVADVNATVEFLRSPTGPWTGSDWASRDSAWAGGLSGWPPAPIRVSGPAVPFYGGNIMVPWGETDGRSLRAWPTASTAPCCFTSARWMPTLHPDDMRKLDNKAHAGWARNTASITHIPVRTTLS